MPAAIGRPKKSRRPGQLEPLLRVRRYLTNAGLWDAAREQALLQDCARQVEAAVAEYLGTPKQSTDAMFDWLFAGPPKQLQEQRATARRYGSKSGGH